MKGKDLSDGKGYAFVTFRNKELASNAIEELNNSELKVIKTKPPLVELYWVRAFVLPTLWLFDWCLFCGESLQNSVDFSCLIVQKIVMV